MTTSSRRRHSCRRRPSPPTPFSSASRVCSLCLPAAGLLRELGNITLPKAVRRTRLYQTMVESTLRFLIEQVGEVEGAYPAEGKLAENFLLQRTVGDGIDLAGLAAFHASPVWVLA